MNYDHGMQFWPPFFLTDIKQFLLAHGDVALTNDMLKDYKVGKAYEYFSSGWLQEGYFLKTKSNNNLCILRTKCSPSHTLDDDPDNVYIYCTKGDDGLTEGAYCSCTAGYEIYACFSNISMVSMQCQFRTIR
jgi:hypothetical protein